MERILSSKLYRGSRHQAKILAALNDPVNKPLVQQITSYIDGEEIQKVEQAKIEKSSDDSTKSVEAKPAVKPSESSSSSHRSAPSTPASFTPRESNSHDDFPELDAEGSDPSEVSPHPLDESTNEDLEESTRVKQTPVTSSTYVTVETVAQAVNEIPGTLNNDEVTKGVTHALLKGGSDNEVWVYYNSDVDINSVLEGVTKTLGIVGYYFLEFDRVARDSNAIVFTINWVSSYYKPISSEEISDEG